eukprot:3264708-Rhodomonas_salina.1
MSGTNIGSAAIIVLRACYAMSGTNIGSAAGIVLRACYAMSGIDARYKSYSRATSALCDVQYHGGNAASA